LTVSYSADRSPLFESDEGSFRFKVRIDGSPSWNGPTTPLNGGSTVSPFIAIAARE